MLLSFRLEFSGSTALVFSVLGDCGGGLKVSPKRMPTYGITIGTTPPGFKEPIRTI